MSHRPDLIVPIRDRRQRKRYLTLRNARNVAIVLVIAFVAITIYSEMRPSTTTGNYGRLSNSEMPEIDQKPVEVVQENAPPVPDQTVPDPMLVAPMAREQWLQGQPGITPDPATSAPVTFANVQGPARIAIVGGPGGVTIVQEPRRKPVLSGGFGRN